MLFRSAIRVRNGKAKVLYELERKGFRGAVIDANDAIQNKK